MDYEVKYKFFNPYLCHVCKTKESFKDAKPCSLCKLIAYCSKEHRKADRVNHKRICNAARRICREEYMLPEDDVFDAGLSVFRLCEETNGTTSQQPKSEWMNLRIWVAASIGDILKQSLDEYEMNMLFRPRHCAICFTRNVKKELVCTSCFGAAYCSVEHKNLDNHEEVCKDLQRTLDIDLFMLDANSTSLQVPLLDPTQVSNLKLDTHDMKSFIANYFGAGLKVEVEALVSFYYTSVLTFAHIINQIPNFTLGESLSIHIVGAEGVREGRVLEYWENLLHLFPQLCAVTLVHIGPGIAGPPTKLMLCDDCNNAKKTVDILVHSQSYHEYYRSSDVKKPDVIIAFNSGLFGYPDYLEIGLFGKPAGYDSWAPSFPFLFQYENIPVILTEKSKREAEADLKRLLSTDVICKKQINVVVNCEQNPFNDLRPWNIWTSQNHEFPCKNSFVSVLIAERC